VFPPLDAPCVPPTPLADPAFDNVPTPPPLPPPSVPPPPFPPPPYPPPSPLLLNEDEGSSPLNRLNENIDDGSGSNRLRMDFPGVGIVTEDEDAVDMDAGVRVMTRPGGGGPEDVCERDGLDKPGGLGRPEG
jgi:hypothetical protein